MALLDIQRQGQQVGRLRIGQIVPASGGKTRPAALDTFRFTTGSRHSADAIADLYGGTVLPWERGQFEIVTRESALPVMVPPREQIISQWYEMWSAGGCQRRCDSQIEQISGSECLCPHASDPSDPVAVAAAAMERDRLAKQRTPQACKPVTRISVMIPDLPTLGVWRLDTGSYYAAVEIGDAAELMQVARERGISLPAILRIDQRQRVANGQTKKYVVPVLEVTASLRQITSGALAAGGITAQLPPARPAARPALTAGSATPPPRQAPAPTGPPMTAEQIAAAAVAATSRDEVWALAEKAKADGLDDALVVTPGNDDEFVELKPFLQDRWRALGGTS